MNRITLDPELFGLYSIIEEKTQALVKDIFREDDIIYVIVAPGEMGKILGKGGQTIQNLQQHLGKKVKAIEYNESVLQFIKNIIFPLQVEEVVQEENLILIKDSQKKTKSLLIGRNGRNLKLINRAVKRFFNLEVKVV